MKLLALLTLLAAAPLPPGEQPEPPRVVKVPEVVARETVGKIRLGQTAAALEGIIGRPERKEKDQIRPTTDQWEQIWQYPARGLNIGMASDKAGGPKTVSWIQAGKPCQMATSHGIKIGSTIAEVRKAYGKDEMKGLNPEGKGFVVGELEACLSFQLEGGKVSGIYIGSLVFAWPS